MREPVIGQEMGRDGERFMGQRDPERQRLGIKSERDRETTASVDNCSRAEFDVSLRPLLCRSVCLEEGAVV